MSKRRVGLLFLLSIVLTISILAYRQIGPEFAFSVAGTESKTLAVDDPTADDEHAESKSIESPKARPGQPASRSASVADDPLRALYAARTAGELKNARAMLSGAAVFDGMELDYYADRFCLYGRSSGIKRSFADLAPKLIGSDTGRGMASARWLDTLRERFCADWAGPSPEYDPLLPLVMAELTGFGDLAELENAAHEYDVDALVAANADPAVVKQARQKQAEIRDQLLDFMANTDSPAAFHRAAESLVSYNNDWYPGDTRAKAALQMGQEHWRLVGAEHAFCRMAPAACAAGSMTTISRCMPINCVPGESLMDFYRRTQSPQTLDIAQTYADALLALRQSGP